MRQEDRYGRSLVEVLLVLPRPESIVEPSRLRSGECRHDRSPGSCPSVSGLHGNPGAGGVEQRLGEPARETDRCRRSLVEPAFYRGHA